MRRMLALRRAEITKCASLLSTGLKLACGSAASGMLGLQMGIGDMLCGGLGGEIGDPASVAHIAFGFCLCLACAFSVVSSEMSRSRWLTSHLVCLRSGAVPFRLAVVLEPPSSLVYVSFVTAAYFPAVLVVVSSNLNMLERALHACVMVVCGVVAFGGHEKLFYDMDAASLVQAAALTEACFAMGLAVGRFCSKRMQRALQEPTDVYAAVVPISTSGIETPDQLISSSSFAATQTIGNPDESRPTVTFPRPATPPAPMSPRTSCSFVSSDDILSLSTPFSEITEGSQTLDSACIEGFAIRSFQSLAARALIASVSCPGDGPHMAAFMSTDSRLPALLPGSRQHAAGRDWLLFLEGEWQVDACCAGSAPLWAFSLDFRRGTVRYHSGVEGQLVFQDGRLHMEGAALVWISDTLIGRYSQMGDHLLWSRSSSAEEVAS
eukprot:TRINITY_DN10515_c0_g4_i1.p1 TRINITY_DN10515_c0_g4~~TRINITY_DN10515_c0_g4_i1.p1  ORF type:complete len:436 (+),score=38.03 TRINITY_DN10515_c0_g4_i1:88-1395(+)